MKSENRFLLKSSIVMLFLLICVNSSSQDNESNTIYKFSTEQGLSSNVIYSILQDQKGFIWIASEEGLNKFDGRNFTHYAVNKGRYSLTHNRTQTLYLAPDGNIWSGTSDGLNIYDYKSDSIIQVRTNTNPLKLAYNDITYLANGNNKNITWVGTYGNGVNYFDWEKQKFFQLLLPKKQTYPQPINVMSLLEDDNKRLWIGTRHNGLYRYDIQNKKLEYFNIAGTGSFIRSIFQDSFRRIWFGTSSGCFVYNETTNHLDAVNYPKEIINNSIGSITEDIHGRIWIGSEQNVVNFSVRSFSLTQPFAYQRINYGLSSNRLNCPSVNTLFADKDNNIWIGTAWGGANMLRGTPTKFRLYKSESESANTLPNSPVAALYSDKNNLYLATMGTGRVGFGIFNIEKESFNELLADKKLKGYIYQAILKDDQGNLWLGTYNKGLIRTDKEGNNIQFYFNDPNNKNSIPDNDIRCITQATDKTLWFGTSNGLAKYDPKTRKLSRETIFKRRIGIRCIKEDDEGTLWIGTYGEGLMCYKPASSKLNMNPVDIVPGMVTDLLIHNDSVWIATRSNGLILYNKRNAKKTIYNESTGLASNYVKSMIRDDSGRIWFATAKGISNLKPRTGEIENYSTQDGVQSSEFMERSAAATYNGRIAFGGFGGINIFDPLTVNKNDKCPAVVFTKLLIFNDIVYPTTGTEKKSAIRANIALSEDIVLKHNQSVFTIEFAGINYYATQKIQYAYFLEGSDKKWNELGNQNSVTFRNLTPGTYTFMVKASSPDAVWTDDNIASIKIIVRPPFWKTWWFLGLIGLLFILILYLIDKERVKRRESLANVRRQIRANLKEEVSTTLNNINVLSEIAKIKADKNLVQAKEF
ncbi:MAG TPA: two-component regulator propeller domain-containing protein, partial [Paludibacter sp.]|nr:two-component regulator propeller domain-containing protein [Paludibacter sp.]